MKKTVCFFICIIFILCLSGCLKAPETGTEYIISSTEAPYTDGTVVPQSPTQAVQVAPATQITQEPTVYEAIPETLSETVTSLVPDTVPLPSLPAASESKPLPSTTKVLEKTGEMAFSDDVNNRYISAISSKYGVDAKTLVALYTVPENDSNIVLQFDGTQNADGSLIRNKDTLIAIYSIDKSLNSKRASEDKKLNEYSYGEMKVMFISTTTYIMPEFEELK